MESDFREFFMHSLMIMIWISLAKLSCFILNINLYIAVEQQTTDS